MRFAYAMLLNVLAAAAAAAAAASARGRALNSRASPGRVARSSWLEAAANRH